MKKRIAGLGLVILILALSGCAARVPSQIQTSMVKSQATKTINTGFVAMAPGIYDSADRAIVVCRDTENMTMSFQNLETGKQYTLVYDGTTSVKDKYGQEIAISQIPDGSIVDNRFFKPKKALTYLQLAADAFVFEKLSNYTFKPENNQITVGSNPYALSGNLCILSNGTRIQAMDINKTDVLRIAGMGNTIYSVVVERGHGYLRLKNDEYFQGGWLEIGQSVIRDIEEDMLVTVPEGVYQVKAIKDNNEANQTITFARNEEMVWDLGTVAITQMQEGSLIFTVHPMEAQITIDGEVIDTSQPYQTTYGVHQLIATADGYDTITQYIKLNDEYANIDITMVETESETEEEGESEGSHDVSENKATTPSVTTTPATAPTTPSTTTTANAEEKESASADSTEQKTTETSKKTYRVYIDSPEGVEVYLDGNYVGVAPVDFKKETGSYVVTLRKSGYQTRSYSISIEDDEQDVNYSFSDLVALED